MFSQPISKRRVRRFAATLSGVAALALVQGVSAHGNVTPQAFDTKGLPAVEGEPDVNPYRGSELAETLGSSAYSQNCARCHGIDAVSGGIAPDLRLLPLGDEGDEYFAGRARKGVTRNGVTYMPAFGEVLGEEAIWAIRTWLESVHVEE